MPVDRICAALQVDLYTAYLPLVAHVPELDPSLGRDGLFADREQSRTFQVIAEGRPYLVKDADWQAHADLAFYGMAVKWNMKELSRSPFRYEPVPIGLALWRARQLADSRASLLAS